MSQKIPNGASYHKNTRDSKKLLDSPSQDCRGPGETGAEGRQHDDVSGLDPALLDRLIEGNRDGGGRCVAVLVDVSDDLLQRDFEDVSDHLADPVVGLVGDEKR